MVKFGSLSLAVFTFTVSLTTTVWSSLEGQPCVIGSIQPIFAAPGDDIILPCHLEPPLNVEGQTIEWSRPDLQPDPSDRLSHVEYVHVYRHRHEVRDMKAQLYVGRTLLFEKELKYGNISLMITNVTVEDTAIYKCYIPKLKSQVKEAFVRLFVEPNSIKTTEMWLHPTDHPSTDPPIEMEDKGVRSHYIVPIVVFLFFLLLCGGYFLKRDLTVKNLPELLEMDCGDWRWNALKPTCAKTAGFSP